MLLGLVDKRVRATMTAVKGDRIRLVVDYPAEDPYLDIIPRAFGEILRRRPCVDDGCEERRASDGR